jgi:hypothetical protein
MQQRAIPLLLALRTSFRYTDPVPKNPSKPDTFTLRRLARCVAEFREKKAQLPTLKDLEEQGFDVRTIDFAVRQKVVKELYVTLTTGAIVKAYKPGSAG